MPDDLAPVRPGARLHFLHVGKTGGTAIKRALRAGRVRRTPYGRLVLHRHRFTLRDVPEDDFVFFCMRDPIARFTSGFYSRRDKGRPRHFFEWTPAEATVFATFTTPEQHAGALAAWYAADYRLLRFCEQVRAARAPARLRLRVPGKGVTWPRRSRG